MKKNTDSQNYLIGNDWKIHVGGQSKKENLLTEEQVKKALKINSFCDMPEDRINAFVDLIPNMDKELACTIIKQFPAYVDYTNNMLAHLNAMCDKVIKDNNSSQTETIKTYQKIIDRLGELLMKDSISKEERNEIIEQMVSLADKISAKDTENKVFLSSISNNWTSVAVGGILIIAAALFGVNVKGPTLPPITK